MEESKEEWVRVSSGRAPAGGFDLAKRALGRPIRIDSDPTVADKRACFQPRRARTPGLFPGPSPVYGLGVGEGNAIVQAAGRKGLKREEKKRRKTRAADWAALLCARAGACRGLSRGMQRGHGPAVAARPK